MVLFTSFFSGRSNDGVVGHELRQLALRLPAPQVAVDQLEAAGRVEGVGLGAAHHLHVDAIANGQSIGGHGDQMKHT